MMARFRHIMMSKTIVRCATLTWACCAWLSTSTPAHAATDTPPVYETGYSDVVEFTSDLYRALAPEQQRLFHPFPVLLDKVKTPLAQPRVCSDGSSALPAVHVTAGFIELMNSLSHAKAIDDVQKGFFKMYVDRLGLETGAELPRSLLDILQSQTLSLDTRNYQMSHFNQMVAASIAVEMAHQYLGHYAKYAGHLTDAQGQPVPINRLVTPEEWHEAVLKGAHHALDCGLGVEGLQVIYESIDRMPKRPAWTIYFLPEKANVSRIKRDLTKVEKDFFLKKPTRG